MWRPRHSHSLSSLTTRKKASRASERSVTRGVARAASGGPGVVAVTYGMGAARKVRPAGTTPMRSSITFRSWGFEAAFNA